MRNAHNPRKVSRPWSHLCVALVSLDRLQHGPCLPLRPPCNRPSYAWAHDRRIRGGQLHTLSCTAAPLPAAVVARSGRVSRSISSHGWCGYHWRCGRGRSETAAAASQQAVTAEISASQPASKPSRRKSQLLSSGWQRTSQVLKSQVSATRIAKKKIPEHFKDYSSSTGAVHGRYSCSCSSTL